MRHSVPVNHGRALVRGDGGPLSNCLSICAICRLSSLGFEEKPHRLRRTIAHDHAAYDANDAAKGYPHYTRIT